MTDPVTRLNAALEGRYRIERELGEGGMATVYLADDLKHERKVALKVLKPELAAVVGAERFLSEIKVTANLTHPHILPLHDSGEADGFLFYVMPYLEGESLRDRIDREKQLPVDEAVRIATAVANALDHAHRHKVIHRDIKPANILLQDGEPVVADFGIALAVGAAGSSRLTETGLSLGTPYYMSPEQATGDQPVGASTDTYALGSVLYEMLVGEPPYPGSTAQAVLGKIISGQPVSTTEQRPAIPANVDAAVRKALEKLPADRFTSAQDFVRALGDEHFRYGEAVVGVGAAGAGPWKRLSIASTALAATFAVAFGWSLSRSVSGPIGRFSINLPDTVPLAFIGSASLGNGRRALAISRDGSNLAYVGSRGGVSQLFIRPIDSYEIEALPGTEGAYNPFFSPDGEWVGFFVENEVRKISLEGQNPVLLATIINPMGADWGIDDQILVGNEGRQLHQVAAEGGLISVLREGFPWPFLYPDILPGGEGVLVSSYNGVRISSLESGEDRLVRPTGSNARYVSSGHLVWSQGSTLFAAPFDLDGWAVTGQGMPVLSGVRTEVYGVSQWDVSETGTLVYASGSAVAERPLTWLSRGVRETLPFQDTPHGTFQLSPDGTRLAIVVRGPPDDIWIYDLRTESRERLTFEGSHNDPVWSPDGSQLAFTKIENDSVFTYVTAVDAGTEPRRLFPQLQGRPTSWSGGGNLVAFKGAPGVAVFNLDESKVYEVAPAPAWGGVLSPNGRLIAYTTGVSGEYQIFVEPFPPTGLRRLVSSEGGSEEPVWSRDGTRLFYRNDQRIMVARIATEPELEPSTPTVAFRGDFVNVGGRSYDVTADGTFLIIDGGDGLTATLNVVPNWLEELKQRVPN